MRRHTWLAMALVACAPGSPRPERLAGTGAPPFTIAPHRAQPLLPLLNPANLTTVPRLVVIQSAADVTMHPIAANAAFAYLDTMANGVWWDAWASDYRIGRPGVVIDVVEDVSGTNNWVPGGKFPSCVPAIAPTGDNKTIIGNFLDAVIADAPNLHIEPDGRTVYVWFAPQNVCFDLPTDSSFHSPYGTLGDSFAYISPPSGGGARGAGGGAYAASHEVPEAVTDPVVGTGWDYHGDAKMPWLYSITIFSEGAGSAEVADLCLKADYVENGFTFNRIFSNTAAAANGDPCAPHLSIPYYASDTSADWFPLAPGATATIPITGWSTAPTADWLVSLSENNESKDLATSAPNGPVAALDPAAPQTSIAGAPYWLLNNGKTIDLTVTMPASAVSGSWAVLLLDNNRLTPTGGRPDGEDNSHRRYVGVYTP